MLSAGFLFLQVLVDDMRMSDMVSIASVIVDMYTSEKSTCISDSGS